MGDQNEKLTDIFAPENLRLDQNYGELAGVKKTLSTIPVRKPNRREFIRVRNGSDWSVETAIFENYEDRETYIIVPSLWDHLTGEWVPKILYTAMNRQGVLFLWPVKLPGEDNSLDQWNTSAHEAAEKAEEGWIRVASNMSLGAYEIFEAVNKFPEPEWPEIELRDILNIAFRDRMIDSLDHPVIQKLRGVL